MSKHVIEFYDEFSSKQIATGINRRHLSIDAWCKKFGLASHHHVLEIGCGIGTQTELIAKTVSQGKIYSYDISPKSIEIAKKRLQNFGNVTLIAADVTEYDFDPQQKFDFIILPDVLEHIPIELHGKLFAKLSTVVKDDGVIFIHIPDPYYNQWIAENKPEIMQVIDQSLYMNDLAPHIYSAGLCLEYLETYNLHASEGDYQVMVLKKVYNKTYAPLIRKETLMQKIKRRLGL